MNDRLSRFIVNPGLRTPITGLLAGVTIDSAIVTETMTETMIYVLKQGGNTAEVA